MKRIALLLFVVGCVWFGGLLGDSQRLYEDVLRLHVVANSDSAEDQAVKLRVRDAVIGSLEEGLSDLTDVAEAKAYITQMLPKLESVANQVLREAGFSETASVSLTEEAFPVRHYDTFSLPSGVYQALRVVIGEGEGENWWCVVFPQLCVPATSEGFVEAASIDDFPDSLTGSLTGEYEIRFWILDQLGKIRNFLNDASE